MTKHLRIFLAALLLVLCGSVGKAAEGDTYKLVTDASELKSGDVVVIASGNKAMGSINEKKTKIESVEVTITNGILNWITGLGETILEGSANNWYLKFNGYYINASGRSESSFSFGNSQDGNKGKFSISISGEAATLTNSYKWFDKVINYNGETFGFGDSANIKIYKKQRRPNELSFLAASVTRSASEIDGTYKSINPLQNKNNLSPITYTSSNTDVAEVNANGDVLMKKYGTTTITATFAGNDSYEQGAPSYTLEVKALPNGIAYTNTSAEADLNDKAAEAKDYGQIVNPNNLPLTYTSSNPYVATVDESGKVSLVSWGKTTITASFAGDNKYESGTASYELNVKNSDADYNENYVEFVAGVDKGSTTSTGNEDNMSKGVVSIHSNNAAFASNPYELRYARGLDIKVEKGNIVRIEIEGDLDNLKQGDNGGGKYEKLSSTKHVWTGSSKLVSVKHSRNTAWGSVKISSIRVYVNYPVVKEYTLNESSANTIEAWENADITLNRTLVADKWNTFCVPFDMTAEQATETFGEGAYIEQFSSYDAAANTIKFTKATSIEAGKPYLVKPTKGGTEYTFSGIELKNVEPTVAGEGSDVTFRGIFSPKDITEGGTVKAAGVTAAGKVQFVNANQETKAFRCYFTVNTTTTVNPESLSVSVNGTVLTGIHGIITGNANADAPVYNLQGQRMTGKQLPKGVYVQNGRKFAVK